MPKCRPSAPPSCAQWLDRRRKRRPLDPRGATATRHEAASSGPLPDGDPQRLSQGEVLFAHRENEKLLHLVGWRRVAGQLRLGGDDLLGNLEVRAQKKPGAACGDLDVLDPALQ